MYAYSVKAVQRVGDTMVINVLKDDLGFSLEELFTGNLLYVRYPIVIQI
jgi:hypothetical protein